MLHLLSRFITILQYINIFYSRYVLVSSNDKLDFSCPFRGLKIFKILPPNAIECEPSTPRSIRHFDMQLLSTMSTHNPAKSR